MPWTYYSDDKGRRWRINQLGMWILVRQNVYNTAIRQCSHVKRVHHTFGPDEVSVETDFQGIAAERDRQSAPLYAKLERESIQNGAQTLARLIQMRHETERSVEDVRQMQHLASAELRRNIERSVHRGEIGVDVATKVRDLSATTLVVGSAFITGGAAVAVLGGGSALKGVGNYEDKGNVGSAVLTATGTFVVGIIPLTGGTLKGAASVMTRVGGEAIKYGERAVLAVVGAGIDAQFQACNALIEGKSGREALQAAAARFAVDVIAGGIGMKLDKWALPVIARIVSDTAVGYGGDKVVDQLAEGGGEARRPGLLEHVAIRRAPAASASMPTPARPAVCDANAVLSSGSCSPDDWVRQIVLQPA
jgi:hypothetical protein